MDALTDPFIESISAGGPRLFILAAIIVFIFGMIIVAVRQTDDERRGMKTFAVEAGYVIFITAMTVLCGPLVSLIPGIA